MQKRFDNALGRLLNQAAERIVLSARPRILVAVSGGVDSIVLANLFCNTSLNVDFAIVHCNFSLRGSSSDADEQFVTFWALNRSITLYKTTFDTAGYASQNHISLEMAARELRYGFFAKTALEEGYDAVAVAHNANDNAETMLLNLVRGTGLAGLGGIRGLSVGESGVLVLRPLLDCTRKQIEAYATAQGLFHCEDSTNNDTTYRRNFLRHKVLPLLEEVNPSVVKTFSGEAGVLASAGDFAAFSAREMVARLVTVVQIGGRSYDKILLSELVAVPGWEYVLYVCLSENYGFNGAMILSLVELIHNRCSATFAGKTFWGDGYELVTCSDGVLIGSRHSEVESKGRSEESQILRAEATQDDGVGVRVSETRSFGPKPLRMTSGVADVSHYSDGTDVSRLTAEGVRRHSEVEHGVRSEESQILRAEATQNDGVGVRVSETRSFGLKPLRMTSGATDVSHYSAGTDVSRLTAEGVRRHSEGSVATEESCYTVNGTTFKVSLVGAKDVDMAAIREGRVYAIDPDKCDFERGGLVVRGYKKGDYMLPFGLRGKKKISDVFADLKWSKPQKDAAVLFFAASERGQASGRGIPAEKDCLLMLGYRISDKVRLTKESKRALLIEIVQ